MKTPPIIGSAIIFFLWSFLCQSQSTSQKFQLDGYVSNLLSFDASGDDLWLDYLLHNRLNISYDASSHLSFHVDFRNRLLVGDRPANIPKLNDFLDLSNDYFDLSVNSKEGKNSLIHFMLDRAYVEYYNNDWEIRIGRQRINWGINNVWNPHDIFNSYSYFDFDHMERPGSDAVRITKYLNTNSSIEFASKMTDNFSDLTSAFIYKWNKKEYDFQLLAGKSQQDIITGLAWSGYIKNMGFKGETSLLIPYQNGNDSDLTFISSIGIDYAFKNNLYINYSFLINSYGSDDIDNNIIVFNSDTQGRNLSPFRYSFLFQHTYLFKELYNFGMAFIYFPGSRNALYLSPSVSYSLKENWELSFITQLYFDDMQANYQNIVELYFLRLKWSF